ncbi:PREDICTED: wall-associated receptor kinase 2-like [Camelina sativa]|uniref:Wall-associated receptor kinase 2-like n=1 Tax=Camelina sativa TaxID=90675 RepID=A0ABM0TN30_CAMSA|nr:PREDICTED: wall-associated receptor kinase 2-like [Camelina sativa]
MLRVNYVGFLLLLLLLCSNSVSDDCKTKCGNLTIDYPFGTSRGCYHDEKFLIRCNQKEQKAFLAKQNLEVLNISLDGEMQILMNTTRTCYNINGDVTKGQEHGVVSTDFTFSSKNQFFRIGCNIITSAIFDGPMRVATECITYCSSPQLNDGSCSVRGGCCRSFLDPGASKLKLETMTYPNRTDVFDFNPCIHTFLVQAGYYNFSGREDLKNLRNLTQFPVLIDWSISDLTCEQAENKSCHQNSVCINRRHGHTCKCQEGFQGNPYIPNGCQDIDECKLSDRHCAEHETCRNTVGSFHCKKRKEWEIILLASIIGILVVLLVICGLVLKYKSRQKGKCREKRFEENGGILLAQRLLDSGTHAPIKIFKEEEIKAATNNYHETRILGKGGQGIVYKGIMPDNTEIAIKKARVGDRDQVGQFINEVVVLSQINHPHVVRLLGCCLETQTPLLVYEYVSGGTLYDNLFGSSLPWEDRLRIAAEIAGTLSYLHSSPPVPLVHRDVKPANVILDDTLSAKVSDFGSSRLFPADKEQLTTLVQGTKGYLDPEYFNTSLLSEKSDVYSFGVLLMELVSGEKAVFFIRPQTEKFLVTHLESALKENRLSDVMDRRVVNEENRWQIYEAALLALRCTKVKGEDRPDMRQVAAELEGLRASGATWVESI